MATMNPGQRGFGQQYNIPGLPFDVGADPLSQMRPRPRGGMRRQGPVDRFDESIGERSRGGRIPPELLQMLMAQLMGGQGGGAQRRPPMGGQRPPQRPPMGRGRPPMRGGPRGGGRPPSGRPPSGRPPMGGGRPPVIKIEDLVRAISGRGGGRRPPQQADMAIPQAPR